MNQLKKAMILAGLKAGLPYLAVGMEEIFHTKNHPKNGKRLPICYAIGMASENLGCTEVEADSAQDHIMDLLGPSVMVSGYLRRIGIPEHLLTAENIQDFRKRRLESLIEEFGG